MGIIEDVRKVIQDLVTPDLKAISARVDSLADRIASLKEIMEANNKALNAKIDSNQATILHSLNIDKRLEALESDRQSDRARATASA
jgi:hypothetical protein